MMNQFSMYAFPVITVFLPIAALALLWIAITLHRIAKDTTNKKEK